MSWPPVKPSRDPIFILAPTLSEYEHWITRQSIGAAWRMSKLRSEFVFLHSAYQLHGLSKVTIIRIGEWYRLDGKLLREIELIERTHL